MTRDDGMPEATGRMRERDGIDLQRYSGMTSGTIGHFGTEGFLDWAIQPIFRPVSMVGFALPVACAPTDNTPLAEAMERAEPGTVLVVHRFGDQRYAPWGGLMSLRAAKQGLAGIVIDGAATDAREIRDLGFPVFARNLSALTTRREQRPGTIGVPVDVGGVSVGEGDVVLGDDDGVVVLPHERAREMLEEGLRFERREAFMRKAFEEGLSPREARAYADARILDAP